MSQQNVEVAQRAVAAFNATDIEAFAALTTPDFEWFPSMIPIENEAFVGADGIRSYFDRLASAWEHFRIFPERILDEADCVLVLARLEGRGRTSGVTVDAALGMAFDLRDGLIWRIRGFLDHDEALRATGLESDPAELTRGAFADPSSLDALLGLLAPDATWEAESLGTSFEGAGAIREFLEDWTGADSEFTAEPVEIAHLGAGIVFVVVRLGGHPRGGAAGALERRRPLIFVWMDGRITRVKAPSSDVDTARGAAQREADARR